MELHDLKPNKGAHKAGQRKGRGYGSGLGKTGGRGSKGQKSRSGGGVRLYHQGGNLPFYRKLPFKRGVGFNPINRIRYEEVNLEKLVDFTSDTEITPEILYEAGIVKTLKMPVKVLGRGEITVPLTVKAHKFSASAQEKIESAGGNVTIISAQD